MRKMRNKQKEQEAKKVVKNEGSRLRMVRYRGNHKMPDVCEACGHQGVTDIHHEGEARDIHYLCPNCHALITRGKKTLDELLVVTQSPESVTIKVDVRRKSMSNYRPEGWKNPNEEYYNACDIPTVQDAEYEAFEAGADAIIEGLRKGGQPTNRCNGRIGAKLLKRIRLSGLYPRRVRW